MSAGNTLNWDRVNGWTNTFYSLIHALSITRQINFGSLDTIDQNVRSAATWITPECSYETAISNPFGDRRIRFRRDPNRHFDEIASRTVKMLVQDLTVILDQMMNEILQGHNMVPHNLPGQKVAQLLPRLPTQHSWAANGCLELIAVRNILVHADGIWNAQGLALVSGFLQNAPQVGDRLVVGFPMLFRYRKAMRTFLNQVQ
jgi:hypothetical protein